MSLREWFDENGRPALITRLILLPILVVVMPVMLIWHYVVDRRDSAIYQKCPVLQVPALPSTPDDHIRYLVPATVGQLRESGVRSREFHAELQLDGLEAQDVWLPHQEFWAGLSVGQNVRTEVWRSSIREVQANGKRDPTKGNDGNPVYNLQDTLRWAPVFVLLELVLVGVWFSDLDDYRKKS